MRAAIINAGVVVNVVELDNLLQLPGAVACPDGSPGDLFDGTTFTKPPKPIATLKAEKSLQLRQVRDAACEANVTAQGKTFTAEQSTQTLLKRLGDRMRRGKPSAIQALLDVNGNPVSPVTQALLDAIEDAIAANAEAAWNRYGQLMGQLSAATTAAQVEAIVW